MEIAFFQVNDSRPGLDGGAKSSSGEEFSLVLSSLMPQNGQGSFFMADSACGAGAGSGLNRSFIEGEKEPVNAGTASLMPQNCQGGFFMPDNACGAGAESGLNRSFIEGEKAPVNAEAASLMPQNGQGGFFMADSACGTGAESGLNRPFIDGAKAPVNAGTPSLTAPQPAQTPVSTDGGFSVLNAMPASTKETPAGSDFAEAIDLSGMTGAQGLEVKSVAQAPELEAADTTAFAGTEFPAGPDETALDAPGDASSVELDESAGSAELSIAFSGGFEDNGNEQGASAEGGADQAVPELTLNKMDAALNAAPFARHLESASVEHLSGAVKSAPSAAEIMDTVEAGIRLSADSRGGEVRMKLNPESLGEVRIRLDVSSGVVKAEITVESLEVKSMIEADSGFLKDSLGSHGLTLDKCVVDVAKPSDMKARPEGFWNEAKGEERAPGRNNRENGGNSHGKFNRDSERGEERGVDFFI